GEQLESDVEGAAEERLSPRAPADEREDCDLEDVDEAGCQDCPVHCQTAVGAQRSLGLPLQSSDDLRRIAMDEFRMWPFERLSERRRDKDRKSTRLNSSHVSISYAVFCLKKKT